MLPKLRAGVDVGGTFTDVVVRDVAGRVSVQKILSTSPDYDVAVKQGLRALVDVDEESRRFAEVVHASTVATNAVLERRGSRTALLTTKGFRDVLELRRIRMPQMYNVFWTKPPPLVERRLRFELDERVDATGHVLKPLDEDEVMNVAALLRTSDVESVAICLLHSHRFPRHEERVAAILRAELPHVDVSASHEILREEREYERTATAVVNAYVRPKVRNYLHEVEQAVRSFGHGAALAIMQSSGGVTTADDAAQKPVYGLESGPAAGVIGAQAIARSVGLENVIALDMGGTTVKASLIEGGRIARSREYELGADISLGTRLVRGGGELLRIPGVDVAEIGAGGGSIAWLDEAAGLHVGPRSAGADPGPACYGLGGREPTVTDANVILGYIPRGALGEGALQISWELAEQAIATRVADPMNLSISEAAFSIHELANAGMMRALRAVSSERGRDPRDFAPKVAMVRDTDGEAEQ